MNIAVIGVGGVGGYFGSKLVLTKREQDHVYFIARGAHLEKIRERGLIVQSSDEGESVCKPDLATDSIAELPMLDMCIVCVKCYDLDKVLSQLKDKIKDTTQIIPLLNGIDIYDRVRKTIKNAYVYPACVYIGTHISEPGVICQEGGQRKILFGKDFQRPDSDAKLAREAFTRAKIDFSWTEGYVSEIWRKYLCVAPYSLVTAAYGKTMWEAYDDSVLSKKVLGIMNVITQIAEKKGIHLPSDSVEKAFQLASQFPHDLKTSFHRDYEKKREQDERDSFGGCIIRMAKEYGIDASVVEEVYNRL